MSRRKCLISAGIFILLTLIKFLLPGAAAELRAQAQKILCRDTDYTQVLLYISSLVPERDAPEPTPELSAAPAPEPPTPTHAYSPRALNSRVPAPTVPAGEELAASVQSRISGGTIAAPDPEPLPEAVQTFIDSQAVFADYGQPANVSYLMPELPFAHSAPVSGYESSGFGYRQHPIQNEVKFHYGADMAAWTGEPVYAFAAGAVTVAQYSDSFGNYITIDHGDGWQTLYAHCSRLDVTAGQSVDCGEQIAAVGATGLVTGPHLHIELTHNGVYINPEYYINSAHEA